MTLVQQRKACPHQMTVEDLDAYEEYLLDNEHERVSTTELQQRLGDRIRLDTDYIGTLLNPKYHKARGAESDRANRAVVEQVLDPRTMAILCKLINKGDLYEINGCISTGKEANVYHATCPDGTHRAIKIYKSTILTFKNRDRYVQGEYRWRHGYCKSNPRKMVQMWAEKEMRNLKRLVSAGIKCPDVHILKLHVLVMDFIGDTNGWPAPRLKDAIIEDYKTVYYEAMVILRRMFHECCLVHADFSEYNLLCYPNHLVVIDVSQSVERDHPRALDFLRSDIGNVVRYFRERGIRTMSIRELYEWITREGQTSYDHLILDELHEGMGCEGEDQVFLHSHIPRNLADVDHEKPLPAILNDKIGSSDVRRMEGMSLQDVTPADIEEVTDRLEGTTFKVSPTREEIKQQRKSNKVKVKTEQRERRAQKRAARRK